MQKKLTLTGIILALIGVLMIVWSFNAPQFGWVGFATGSSNAIILAGLGVLFIWIGFTGEDFSFYLLIRWLKPVGIVILNTVLFFFIIELLITSGINIKNQVILNDQVWLAERELRADFPYYAEREWGATYWQEYDDSVDKHYEPYALWRRQPFSGQTINIDTDGIRLTPDSECDNPDAFVLFFMGGSTAWGIGAPDWGTIPAYLQAQYSEQTERSLCIINYGEDGYVTTQDFITLTRQLQQGNVPDAVIFYGPLNDISASIVNNEAGSHLGRGGFIGLFENTALTQFIGMINRSYTARTLRTLRPANQINIPELEISDRNSEVISIYLNTYDMVNVLAQGYDFRFAFFIQPSLTITEKPLNVIELNTLNNQDVNQKNIEETIYRTLQAESLDRDQMDLLIDVFDETTEHVWIDWFHLTPTGNEIIAGAISEQFDPFSTILTD